MAGRTRTPQLDLPQTSPAAPEGPAIRRVKHELMRRTLTVAAVTRLTPAMIRLRLTGDDLASFASASPDDHIKIFVPGPDGEPVGRDYTPRAFDTARRELVVDVADHAAGPAAAWARAAKAGDEVTIGGPRGSAVIEGPVERWVLVADETALPAMGRRIEELAPGTPVVSIGAVTGPGEEQTFTTEAALDARWIHRPAAASADPAPLLAALADVELTPATFVWAAAEADVARAVRRMLIEERGHPRSWIKAAGYWAKGRADGAVKSIGD